MFREPIITGELYHIYNKSISGYEIFNNDSEYFRMKETMQYYRADKPSIKFSRFKEMSISYSKVLGSNTEKLMQIICYCIMPTHIHLVLKQLKDKGISVFMSNMLNSYSRYFNIKHNRKGPLWEGRFEKVLVKTDEQLLHLTRYIHLNPPTAYLVNSPIDWKWSSYGEYISDNKHGICKFDDVLDIKPDSYKTFVEDRISYQRELAKIKALMIN